MLIMPPVTLFPLLNHIEDIYTGSNLLMVPTHTRTWVLVFIIIVLQLKIEVYLNTTSILTIVTKSSARNY